MATKPLTAMFLILSSYVMVGFSEDADIDGLLQGISKSDPELTKLMGGPDSLPCLNKLLPCKEFLQNSETQPNQACCQPLKELIADDKKCLCDVLSDESILKTLNSTKEDAMKLPKSCSADIDASVCNALPPSSSSGSTSPSTHGEKTPGHTTESTSSKSAAYGRSNFGVSGYFALLIAFIFYQMPY